MFQVFWLLFSADTIQILIHVLKNTVVFLHQNVFYTEKQGKIIEKIENVYTQGKKKGK